MTDARKVASVLQNLHEKKIVNLDTQLRSVLTDVDSLDGLDPGGNVASGIIAWDGYAVIHGSSLTSVVEVSELGAQIRESLGQESTKAGR